jgi:ethanolaminephosphotransferase
MQALLTGTVPSFWDVLFNYNSSRLELDNLLFQYKRRYPEKKIVFYGDDTWIKLFPDSTFHRSYGLQSFFVTDFKEV